MWFSRTDRNNATRAGSPKRPPSAFSVKSPEEIAQSAKDVRIRTNTAAGMESTLGMLMTVTSLLIGSSIALISFVDYDQTLVIRDLWIAAYPESKAEYMGLFSFMYDGAVACSYLAFWFSGISFCVASPLYLSLLSLDIHPLDYTSAAIWESTFIYLMNTIVVFIIVAVVVLAIGFGSAVNLVIVPTLFGSVMARFGYFFLPLWVILLVLAFIAHHRAHVQIAAIRAKD